MRRAIAAGAVVAMALAIAPAVSIIQTATAAPTQYAADSFNRTVTNGWGTADVGGAWSLAGSASAFSVSGGSGRMVMSTAGAGFDAYLSGVSSSDTQTQVGISLNQVQTGGGTYVSVIGRRFSSNSDYRVKVHFVAGGTVTETLERVVGGTETALQTVTAPMTYVAGAVVLVQLQVTGTSPTTLRSMAWLQGTTQPATWQATATDNTSGQQVPGAVELLVYLSGSATKLPETAAFSAYSVTSTSTANVLPTYASIANATKLAAGYYRTTLAHTTVTPTNGWSWSTYTQGLQTLFNQVGDQLYLNDNLSWGTSNAWALATADEEPNRFQAVQTYYDVNALDSTASLSKADTAMASDLTNLPTSQYYYEDALFVALPAWTRWATRTGNSAYLDKMDALYTWTRDNGATSSVCAGSTPPQTGLFDSTRGLWYRDCRYVGVHDANGQPIFWSRGNGWVIAAMAKVLQTLPTTDGRRAKYVSMLQTMAASLAPLQGSDGFWRSSLLDASLYPSPETSGTALITYGLAYGIKAGLLNSATYLPVVAKAWKGLSTVALQPSGFITDCQPVGEAPDASYTAAGPTTEQTSTSSGTVNADEPPFCAGAFLLAGAQVAQLIASPSTGQPAVATGQPVVGYGANRVNDGNVATRWSVSGFPQSVTVDLGSNKSVSNAQVVPYLDRAYRYRVQTSTDNAHWTTVIDRTANTATGTHIDNFTTGAVSARYVRLTVTGVYGVSTTWVSIQEFAVYP